MYKLGTNERIEDTAEARISQEIVYYIQTSSKIKDPLKSIPDMTYLPSARTPKAAVSFETTILTSDSPGYLLFGATSTLKIATNIILEMENDLKTTMIFSIRNIAKGTSVLGVTFFKRTQK